MFSKCRKFCTYNRSSVVAILKSGKKALLKSTEATSSGQAADRFQRVERDLIAKPVRWILGVLTILAAMTRSCGAHPTCPENWFYDAAASVCTDCEDACNPLRKSRHWCMEYIESCFGKSDMGVSFSNT
jgi:hypothetical protein